MRFATDNSNIYARNRAIIYKIQVVLFSHYHILLQRLHRIYLVIFLLGHYVDFTEGASPDDRFDLEIIDTDVL